MCSLGIFGTAVSPHRPVDSVAKPPADPSGGIYVLSSSHLDSDESPRPVEVKVSPTLPER